MAVRKNCDKTTDKFCDRLTSFTTDLPISNILAAMSLFDTINRETEELLPYNVFVVTRCYKIVEIQRCNGRVVA